MGADHDREVKRGRPKLPPEERLDEVLKTNVTTDEADALYRLARHKRMDLAAMIRETLRRLLRDESGGAGDDHAPSRSTWGR